MEIQKFKSINKMDNTKAFKIFTEETHGAEIEKLIWIAGSWESNELKDLMEEIDDSELFEEVFKIKHFDSNFLNETLFDYKKFGFVAQVNFPILKNFQYKDGKNEPFAWSGSKGYCRVEYLYEETIENLLLSIEDRAAKLFKEFIKQDKQQSQ